MGVNVIFTGSQHWPILLPMQGRCGQLPWACERLKRVVKGNLSDDSDDDMN